MRLYYLIPLILLSVSFVGVSGDDIDLINYTGIGSSGIHGMNNGTIHIPGEVVFNSSNNNYITLIHNVTNNRIITFPDASGTVSLGGAGGGNMSVLNDAGDVSLTNPTNNQILRYNGLQWINVNLPGSGDLYLDDLLDVIITSPSYLSTLFYDGTNWIDRIFTINSQTCGGTQKISAINNQTGAVTCTDDQEGTGEVNTGSNIGSGEGNVFAGKSGVDLQFKKLRAGSGITIQDYSNNILLNSTGGVTTMESLTNVTDVGCATGQIRKVSGANWVCANDDTGAGATTLDGLADVTISGAAYNHIIQYNQALAQWVNKLFSVNSQTALVDFQIIGINNQTGVITTNQFSVNSLTCGGTDKISSINNATGNVICTTDLDSVGATDLNGLSDVTITSADYGDILQYSAGAVNQWIDKLFRIDTQSAANDFQIVGINNQTGAITRNQFSVNTEDAGYFNRIKSINNVTGHVSYDTIDFIDTTNCGYGSRVQSVDNVTGVVTCDTIDFVDTITCSGTDKVSAINNITGVVTCTADSGGGGVSGIPLLPKKWGELIPRSASTDTMGLVAGCTILATASYAYGADNSGAIVSTTAATAGINGGIHCTTANHNVFRGDQNAYMYSRFAENKITLNRMFVGFSSSATHLPNNADTILDSISGAGLCIKTTDTVYQFCSNDGTGATTYASLTTSEDANMHFFEVYTTDGGVNWCGKLDGGTAVCTSVAADKPTATTRMYAQSTMESSTAAASVFTQYSWYLQSDK